MGLNDNVYNISKIISAENSKKREEKQEIIYWQKMENNIKEDLLNNLIDELTNGVSNIYNENYKKYIIDLTFNDYISQEKIRKIFNKNIEKFETLKKSITFYYFKICQEAETIHKKRTKQDLELKKFELQQQKFEFEKNYKLQKLELAANKELAKNKTTTDLSWIAPFLLGIVKISLCVVIAPVFLVGFFFLGFLKAITK